MSADEPDSRQIALAGLRGFLSNCPAVAVLDIDEVEQQIAHLKLPANIERLGCYFLKSRHV